MRTALILVAALAAAGTPVHAAEPVVREAWIALLPPGAAVTAAYFVLDNPSDRAVTVQAVEVEGFARAELHETITRGDRVRMRALARANVAPGARLVAAPGRVHIMLSGASRVIAAGTRLRLVLLLGDGRRLETLAEVRDPRAADDHAHHH